jgi:hypothetical protein
MAASSRASLAMCPVHYDDAASPFTSPRRATPSGSASAILQSGAAPRDPSTRSPHLPTRCTTTARRTDGTLYRHVSPREAISLAELHGAYDLPGMRGHIQTRPPTSRPVRAPARTAYPRSKVGALSYPQGGQLHMLTK